MSSTCPASLGRIWRATPFFPSLPNSWRTTSHSCQNSLGSCWLRPVLPRKFCTAHCKFTTFAVRKKIFFRVEASYAQMNLLELFGKVEIERVSEQYELSANGFLPARCATNLPQSLEAFEALF